MFYLLVALVFCVERFRNEEEPSSEFIHELTTSNIDENIKNYRFILTLFYAPWCGHCKRLMPEYEKTCKQVKSSGNPSVLCGRIDCTINWAICETHGIKGYPTLKTLMSGNNCEYTGERTHEGIMEWFNQVVSASETTDNVEKVNELLKEPFVLIAYFDDEHEHLKIFDTLSCSSLSLKMIKINDEVAKNIGITKKNTFNLYKNGQLLKVIEYEDNLTVFKNTLWLSTTPLVPKYTNEESSKVFSEGMKHYVAFLHDKSEDYDKYIKSLEDLATNMDGKVRVFSTDVSIRENKNVIEFFSASKFPLILFYNDENSAFYHYEGSDYSPDSLKAFYEGCLDGTVPRYLKKQPIPEDWDKNPVKVLVVDNFYQALEQYKKAIILFYASWCGHCEALMPTWNQLGEHVSKVYPDILFAKLDHPSNEMPAYNITGYPTIYAFKSREEYVPYKGERTFAAIEEFIKKTLIDETAESPEVEKEDKQDEL